jgi:Ca-activated chloride channel family protein
MGQSGGNVQPVEDAITDLGLRHSLLTPFTSFVAVDQEVANRTGQSDQVRQPLPMPQGVSNLAVAQETRALKSVSGYGMGMMGSLGTGSGGAGRGLMGAPAAAPMRMKRMAVEDADEAAPKEAKVEKAKDDRRAEPTKPVTSPAVIVASTPAGLQSPELLVAALKTRLAAIKWDEAPRHAAAQLTLRLTVDAAGKVVAVDIVSGDAALGAFVKAKLAGLTSGAKATAKPATLTVTLRVGG